MNINHVFLNLKGASIVVVHVRGEFKNEEKSCIILQRWFHFLVVE